MGTLQEKGGHTGVRALACKDKDLAQSRIIGEVRAPSSGPVLDGKARPVGPCELVPPWGE